MKGIIISTASLLLSISAYSQTQSISTITLKNGIIIEGVVEYVDVNDGVVMLVGGAKTTIPMTNTNP